MQSHTSSQDTWRKPAFSPRVGNIPNVPHYCMVGYHEILAPPDGETEELIYNRIIIAIYGETEVQIYNHSI